MNQKGGPMDSEAPEHNLRNLLAIIHRDGGHYAAEHGLEKATQDAMSIVYGYREWMNRAIYSINKVLEESPLND